VLNEPLPAPAEPRVKVNCTSATTPATWPSVEAAFTPRQTRSTTDWGGVRAGVHSSAPQMAPAADLVAELTTPNCPPSALDLVPARPSSFEHISLVDSSEFSDMLQAQTHTATTISTLFGDGAYQADVADPANVDVAGVDFADANFVGADVAEVHGAEAAAVDAKVGETAVASGAPSLPSADVAIEAPVARAPADVAIEAHVARAVASRKVRCGAVIRRGQTNKQTKRGLSQSTATRPPIKGMRACVHACMRACVHHLPSLVAHST
jgi:hypothetical protein